MRGWGQSLRKMSERSNWLMLGIASGGARQRWSQELSRSEEGGGRQARYCHRCQLHRCRCYHHRNRRCCCRPMRRPPLPASAPPAPAAPVSSAVPAAVAARHHEVHGEGGTEGDSLSERGTPPLPSFFLPQPPASLCQLASLSPLPPLAAVTERRGYYDVNRHHKYTLHN